MGQAAKSAGGETCIAHVVMFVRFPAKGVRCPLLLFTVVLIRMTIYRRTASVVADIKRSICGSCGEGGVRDFCAETADNSPPQVSEEKKRETAALSRTSGGPGSKRTSAPVAHDLQKLE